ncbi:hypothetical protein KZP23_16605 [Echinicola marina]|uniref:hypothetical protein n=1 Tax=Echinicola marina TaxID=2859768 RepID=UPI001CF6BF17|nr:hypothetical protein [Echinicola marina]UCS92311.1 hypothetical protein KZP23_16605 [Echinicola marina]
MRPYLSIQEDEEVFIPKKYHKINDLCAIIYDQLTEIYREDNYVELNSTTIDLDNADEKLKSLDKEGKHILDWLKENNRNDEIETVLLKHLTMAITSDFINFLFESLYTAKRGKMTVAYSLIRKPYSDILLILEQLFVNKSEFIERFFHIGDPKGYDPSNRAINRLDIIEQALSKIRISDLLNAEHIHDLRYDKELDYGLNGITNHALHIVTNDKRYKTENQNLNFVFSNEEDMERYYEHYYNFVPYLLIYSVSVVDGIIFDLLKDPYNQKLRVVKEFRRLIALIMLMEYTGIRTKKSNKRIFKAIADAISIECIICENVNKIERADCELFLETELLLCSKCGNNILSTNEAVDAIEQILK